MTVLLQTSSVPDPAVSFVISAFNAERFIEEAVRSILAQSAPPFEVVILDDASTDGTLPILRRLADADARITLLHLDEKLYVSGARNRAFEFVRAPWMCVFDADDIMLPDAFAPYFHHITSHPDAQWGYCGMRHTDAFGKPNGHETRNRFDFVKMLQVNILPHPMALLKTELFRTLGGYDESLPHSVDYDLWLRAMEWTEPLFYNRCGLLYRRHAHTIGAANQGPNRVHELMQERIQTPHENPVVNRRRALMRRASDVLAAALAGHWPEVISPAQALREQGVNSFVLDYYLATAFSRTGRLQEAMKLCLPWIRFLAEGGFLNGDEAAALALIACRLGCAAQSPDWLGAVLPYAHFVQQHLPNAELAALIGRLNAASGATAQQSGAGTPNRNARVPETIRG